MNWIAWLGDDPMRTFNSRFHIFHATGAFWITNLAGAITSFHFSRDSLGDIAVTTRLNFLEQHALSESETVANCHRVRRFLEPDTHAQIDFLQSLTVRMEINPAVSGTAERKTSIAHLIQKLRHDHVLQSDNTHRPAAIAAVRTQRIPTVARLRSV
jgi:hypothetical protein